jgi:hypothetical protein
MAIRRVACVAAAVLTAALLFQPDARAEQWGHWRGPLGNGTAGAATPPVEFSETSNVRWKAVIDGRGSSSPVVWDDAVIVTTAVPLDGSTGQFDFRVVCLDRATGKEKWSRSAVQASPHEATHETNGFASGSPCTDGTHVYAHFGSRGLFCFTMAGELVWKRDFGDMQVRHGFGEGSSPTLAGDLIIVPWDHEGHPAGGAISPGGGMLCGRTRKTRLTSPPRCCLATGCTSTRKRQGCSRA